MPQTLTVNDILKYMPFIYLAAISIIAVAVTCYDKRAAKKHPDKRTPEATLLFISILGGSVAMYITMKIIRHKTLHKKFMIGIPVIILCQIAALLGIWYFFIR